MVNKKATLLIRNLHLIYTMTEKNNKPHVLHDGFIAVHHDEILELGTHNFTHLIDKDTRILDGTNHIAVPAFIEADAAMLSPYSDIREMDAYFMRYMKNGTLNIHMNQPVHKALHQNYHYEILCDAAVSDDVRILHALHQMKQHTCMPPQPFCISCADDKVSLQNQMLAAQMLAMKENVDSFELLMALTRYPAMRLDLKDRGMLKAGMKADILVLCAENIHAFFYSLDQDQITQIIHKGVRIYPNLLI